MMMVFHLEHSNLHLDPGIADVYNVWSRTHNTAIIWIKLASENLSLKLGRYLFCSSAMA